ncbi:MAG TPA: DNA-3-methyladenine glycosylase I [Usitatibacter sp.]|jgi:DNA-3-methyladenine glycosylase I|nr:DNA-3-methyladenine glycosylase I [Usitatibacter sp.]
MHRCKWAASEPLFFAYHDDEWGTPLHDDRLLFEMLNLEGAQAGLSWLTILRKRGEYRRAFEDFDAAKIERYGARDKARLLANAGIVRNRAKVDAVIGNARAFLAVQREHGSFDRFLWSFVEGRPLPRSRRRKAQQVSRDLSRELARRGFKFVGPTICFAFMQATGMVDDHEPGCFRHANRARSAAD